MAGTDATVEAGATDALVRQWRASENRAEQIAAELAAKIDAGQLHRWDELPPNAVLTDEYAVAVRTITRAKSLLAGHHFLTKEDRRYCIS